MRLDPEENSELTIAKPGDALTPAFVTACPQEDAELLSHFHAIQGADDRRSVIKYARLMTRINRPATSTPAAPNPQEQRP